jgi:catechol 2,3-dioxygenase-like lactoylglutathione lyase family enzyme
MLQHVSVEVRPDQLDACVAFWERLGFEHVEPPPLLRDRFTWVQREGTQIHMIPTDDPTTMVMGHVAVVVEDFDARVDALREDGFELREGENAWDARRWFLRDPAGNLVELMERAPHPPWPGEGQA